MADVLREARAMPRPAVVRVPAGTYALEDALRFTAADSGLRFVADGEVIVDGGRRVTGWKRHDGDVWVADVPWVKRFEKTFRFLYVNGEARPLACSVKDRRPGNFHLARGGGDRIANDGGLFKADWKDVENAEVTFYHFWVDTHLRLKKIDEAKKQVIFSQRARMGLGTGNVNNEEGRNNAWFIIENLYELMTEPGEWYLDELHQKLYYRARPGEDVAKAEVIAPYADELVVFESAVEKGEKPVKDVVFEGFTFRHSNFTLSAEDRNDFQASQGVKAAVRFRGAERCGFRNCRFEDLSGYGAKFGYGARDCFVEDSALVRLGAGGVMLDGSADEADPFGACRGNRVERNRIERYGRRYKSAVGALIMNASGTVLKGNVIHDGFYSGVSVGWVWGYRHSVARDNLVEGNEISLIGQGVLSDMGGIYTLGVSPGTVIRGNRVHDVDARCYGGWGIYNDEGSTGILIENNVVWNTKFAGYDVHYARECLVRNNVFALGRLEQLSFTCPEPHTTTYLYNNVFYWKTGKLMEGNWGRHPFLYYHHPRRAQETRVDSFRADRNVYFKAGSAVDGVTWGYDVLNNVTNGVSFAEWQAGGNDVNSVYADPGFADPEHGDFTMKPDSPAIKLGFRTEGVPLRGTGRSDGWYAY